MIDDIYQAGELIRLGKAKMVEGKISQGTSLLKLATLFSSHEPLAHLEYGMALSSCGHHELALTSHLRALALAPGDLTVRFAVAQTKHQLCLIDEALEDYNQLIAEYPGFVEASSFRLVALNYRSGNIQQNKRAATDYGALLLGKEKPLARQKNPRYRIGFLSPDFHEHSCAYFILPLLERVPEDTDVVLYYDNIHVDTFTKRFQELGTFKSVYEFDNAALEEIIRSDHLDVLVDLAGHLGKNRLEIFGHRVAPVQVSYLGYPATTGVPTMDFRIADPIADLGRQEHFTEKLLYLEGSMWAYQRPAIPEKSENEPKLAAFGYFGMLSKITREVATVWNMILSAVPDSKLLIKGVLGNNRQMWHDRLGGWGLDMARVIMVDRTATVTDHLRMYRQISVALDTWPYNGTATTCEALVMGVPVVTLEGDVHAGRVGASLLRTVNPRRVAKNTLEYVNIAVAAAKDERRITLPARTAWLNVNAVSTEFWEAIHECCQHA